MNSSGIALLIPAHNAAAFLPCLLRSAQAQTVPFSEILLYDDASTDDTAAVAEQYGAVVVRGTKNVGCATGKNILARHCKSDWLHFHDADDELTHDFVEKALPWTREGCPVDVVLFDYEARDHETGQHLYYRRFDPQALSSDALTYALAEQINPFCGLYRRQSFHSVGGWNEDRDMLHSEDQAGHLRMAFGGLRFAGAGPSATTVINHIRQGSMSTGNVRASNRSVLFVLKDALTRTSLPTHRRIIGERLWITAGKAAALLDWDTADTAALLAQGTGAPLPSSAKPLTRLLIPLCPRLFLRAREAMIRLLKPGQRGTARG